MTTTAGAPAPEGLVVGDRRTLRAVWTDWQALPPVEMADGEATVDFADWLDAYVEYRTRDLAAVVELGPFVAYHLASPADMEALFPR